jgi:hypothetical protein
MSGGRRNPAVGLAVEALRRRGVSVDAITGKGGQTVLLIGEIEERDPTKCVRCSAALVVRDGPGRPRKLCDRCRHPLGPKQERQALQLATARGHPPWSDGYETFLEEMREAVRGRRD